MNTHKSRHKIALLPGDGIGPEITQQAVKVLRAIETRFDRKFDIEQADFGGIAIANHGNPLPEKTLDLCLDSDVVLLGAIGDPKYDNDPKIQVRPEQGLLGLRKALQLHTNIRPVKAYPFLFPVSPLKENRLKGIDLTIYRELTGGIYFGEKSRSEDRNSALDTCAYSREEIERIAVQAFAEAGKRKKKLTLVDKANVLETSRLWREVIQDMSKDYPEVTVDYLFVDNAAMKIVTHPSSFDVVLTENMFGDILSDIASVLCGSIGLLPSASAGSKYALFEPVHGSYPQAAGLDKANPIAMILSSAMMCRHLGLEEEASMIEDTVQWSLDEGYSTEDINTDNPLDCSLVGEMIALKIEHGDEFSPKKHIVGQGNFYI